MSIMLDPATWVETRTSLFASLPSLWCDGCQEQVVPDSGCETPTGFACPDCRTDFWLES